jgi:hypothetical protein
MTGRVAAGWSIMEPQLWTSLDVLACQRDGRFAESEGVGDDPGRAVVSDLTYLNPNYG